MKHVYKASNLFAKLRKRNWMQHQPNTTTNGHNDDQPENFDLNQTGQHPRSVGTKHNYDWSEHQFQYHWNSLGLRGPEPDKNATKKILAIGNSLVLGSGVPVEDTFIHKVSDHYNANYINLSDNFVLTDVIDSTKDILNWYHPDLIYISDFRFIDAGTLIAWYLRKEANLDNFDRSEMYQMLVDSMCKTINMFEDMIRLYAPNARVFWDIIHNDGGGRKKSLGDNFTDPKVIECLSFPHYIYTNKEILHDLGRDNKHPGIKGHQWMTDRVIKIIGETLNG